MSHRLRLHYAPDNASLCIRLALEELGLPYETVLVNRATHAQRSPAYLALNPNGLIPVLETPDGPLFETGAILLWLADTHGGLRPFASDRSWRRLPRASRRKCGRNMPLAMFVVRQNFHFTRVAAHAERQ